MSDISCETQGHLWGSNNACVMCNAPQPIELRAESKLLLCGDSLVKANERISALESQDEVHWKTRRTLLTRIAALEAQLVEAKKLAYATEGAIAQAQARIASFEAALREARGWMSECTDTTKIDALLTASEIPRTAHSKSEYKRLTALGVDCTPPETVRKPVRVGCETDEGTLIVHAESETCEVCSPKETFGVKL